jgi:uncharacterized protein (TIGR00369 family)
MTTNSLLEQWLEEEKISLQKISGGAGPGVASLDKLASLTGLEQMQSMLNGDIPHASMGPTVGFTMIYVGDGQAVVQGAPNHSHLNPMGTVHGGWFATLLDTAMGCATHTKMPLGRAYTTTELSVKLVRAITPQVSRVRAIGQVIHCGRQLATSEAKLLGPDGTLYAHATSSCLIFDLKK